MFRAITKGNASKTAEQPGTLTALWQKKQPGEEALETQNTPDDAGKQPSDEREEREEAPQATPEVAAKVAGDTAPARPPATAVAINAAPDPSPEPIAASKPAPKVQSTTTDKKRKREALTGEQVSKLEAAFQRSEYPGAADKAELAGGLVLEQDQVDRWFAKRRKQQREETGEASKPGRRKAGSSGKLAQQQQAEPAGKAQQEGGEEKAGQQPAEAGEAQGPQLAEDAAVPMDAQAEGTAAEPMDVEDADAADQPAATPADDAVTPAAALRGPGTTSQDPTGGRHTTTADRPAAGGSASKPAPDAVGTGGGKPNTTPAAAAPPRSVSAEERLQLLAQLSAEAAALRQDGLAAPLLEIPGAPVDRLPLSDAKLVAYVAGQRLPLSKLTEALLPVFKAPEGEAAVEQAVLLSRIVDLAARKSFGSMDGHSSLVDGLEDEAKEYMWQWELRDAKHLPKEHRGAAAAAKKRAARVLDRLKAVSSAIKLLEAHGGGKASARLSKVLDALQRVKTLEQVESELAAELDQQATQEAAKMEASAAKKQVATTMTADEKERAKAEKEAEKAAKEAEKERAKAEKEARQAEKEAQKEARAAEKERKHKEAEDKKVHKKTGFKDTTALKQTANKFMSFFKAPAAKAAAAEGAASPANAAAAAASPSVQQQQQHTGASSQQPQASQQTSQRQQPQQQGQGATSRAPGGKRERSYFEYFLKPQDAILYRPLESRAEAMDAAYSQAHAPQQLQADWQALVDHTREVRRAAAAAGPPVLGLPPSWARRSDGVEVAQARLQALWETGLDPAGVKLWRRKFLYFQGDGSQRPPYCGSFTLRSTNVGPRRYLGKDEVMDYEVMSDQEWEDEGDGDSLSKPDGESELPETDAEQDSSFICSDGHLSENEGIQVEDEMDVDSMDAAILPPLGEGADEEMQREHAMAQLQQQLERARKAHKPLIISRLPAVGGGSGSAASPGPGLASGAGAGGAKQPAAQHIQGDPSLLRALVGIVLAPGVFFRVPEDPETTGVGAAPAAAMATPGKTAAAGDGGLAAAAAAEGGSAKPSARGKRERPEELVPELLRLLAANPKSSKQKITDDFLQAHAAGRNVPKKWVHDRIKDTADWVGAQWRLKPDAAAALEAAGTAAAGPPTAGAGAAAVAAGEAEAEVQIAEVVAEAPAAAADDVAGQATPAAEGAGPRQQPATAGPMDRFLARHGDKMPAVPTALKPAAPASIPKAPQRLVTTTATGTTPAGTAAAAQLPPLDVPPGAVELGTSDPYWRRMVQHIEAADCTPVAGAGFSLEGAAAEPDLSFAAAFNAAAVERHISALPAFVVSALVGVAVHTVHPALRAVCLHSLQHVTEALAAAEAARGAGGNQQAEEEIEASQRPWVVDRTAPLVASMEGLCREPQLQEALLAGLAATRASSSLGSESAVAALALPAALLRSETGRAVLLAPSTSGSGSQPLVAVAEAGKLLAEGCQADGELQDAVAALERQLAGQ